MPNPTPLGNSCFPVDLSEVGCHIAVNTAQSILAAGVSALAPLVTGASESEGVKGIVSMGKPFVWPTMPFTLVAVYLARIPMMSKKPDKPQVPNLPAVRRFISELWLPGFPTVRAGGVAGTEMVVPDIPVRDTAGRNATIIGETWANGICVAMESLVCNTWAVSDLVPIQTADLAGWSITVETT